MTTTRAVLVTGGAGYIGSHTVLALLEAGWHVTVLDNLSTGDRALLPDDIELIEGDAGDTPLVAGLLKRLHCTNVIHFAASAIVPESFENPLLYYRNNASVTCGLLDACRAAGVEGFVFSSTAAVYGLSENWVVDESAPLNPISPYGRSKLAAEWMIRDAAAAFSFRHAILRYFNVAGADPQGRSGQPASGGKHLIRVACQAALGVRPDLMVFGTDYDTPDGTCIRDFIHVSDLAQAHVAALDHMARGGESVTLNCGYGKGCSVRDVLRAVERVAGSAIKVTETSRRPGDPVCLIADNARITRTLAWKPVFTDLDSIIRHTLQWERRNHCAPLA